LGHGGVQDLVGGDDAEVATAAAAKRPVQVGVLGGGRGDDGTEIAMYTAKNAPKLPSLRHNPAGAENPIHGLWRAGSCGRPLIAG
jgi:hypothetical protein